MSKRIAIGVFALLLLAAACDSSKSIVGRSTDTSKGDARTTVGQSKPNSTLEYAPGPPDALAKVAPGSPDSTTVDSQVPFAGPKIIRNASLEIRIAKNSFQSKFFKAGAIAAELGGFVSNSSTEQTKGRLASGSLTIRVPSDKFQDALAKLKGLGTVTAESQSGQDVTKDFVDLEARLRHQRAQETFYLKLIDQSKTIADLVQVQQQLSNVQLQIEELQGQLNYLKDQTSFSSITARIFEPVAAAKSDPKGLGKALREALAGFKSVIAWLVVVLGWIAPFGLIAALGYIVWRIRRKAAKAPAGDPISS